ncbi:MAG: bifunctional acetaldehyde-CoA/alcohol dehydrogenase [Gemmataceae bacterium]
MTTLINTQQLNDRDKPTAAVAESVEQTGRVSTIEELDGLIARVRQAQLIMASFDQEKVDAIFKAAALAANSARIRLAREAVEETGMGVLEDKVIKNHFAAEYVYNKFKDTPTCGIIETDEMYGIHKIAEPVGLIAGVVPTTNPTSTAIFKALLALKTRNGIIFSPHPRAKKSTCAAAKLVLEAAVKAGAPEDIVGWIDEPSVELSKYLMDHHEIDLVLATGGPGMVKAAYSSGKPAIGVGAGNTPAVIDETANIAMAVNSILLSKTFDNGMICASEQSIVVVDDVYEDVRQELTKRGAVLLNDEQRQLLVEVLQVNGKLNAKIVGQPAAEIARMAGFEVPPETKVLVAEAERVGLDEPLSIEKLSPVLAIYRVPDFEEAVQKAEALVQFGGRGHTAVLYTNPNNKRRIEVYGLRLQAGRILVNQPASHGAIGDLYNFRLEPSLTLGCGSYGGNSVSENVGVRQLLNFKNVTERRENMLWFRLPPKVYFKPGCLPVALAELKDRKRAFVVTDEPLFNLGYAEKVTSVLEEMGLETEVFFDVKPDPDLATVEKGVARLQAFKPDVIVAIGGGSPMDAAKVMWLLYEYPEVKFENLAMRFMDIRKRVFTFPELGKKALMVAVPTTSGTGSEVTPFAVVTDEHNHIKYPIADYELTPDMAIVDSQLVLNMPKSLTAFGGLDALTHAIECMVSVVATDYTNGPALEAIRLLFANLPAAYREGAKDPIAREKVHNAATLAGMAFANGFLGICHSLAHKLGSAFELPHGLANAILLPHVIRYNATDAPPKQAAFPQYEYPSAKQRYARIADYVGLGGNTEDEKIENLIGAIEKLRDQLEVPPSIGEAGVDRATFMAKLDDIAEQAFDDQCTVANPRYPLIVDLRELYLKAYDNVR